MPCKRWTPGDAQWLCVSCVSPAAEPSVLNNALATSTPVPTLREGGSWFSRRMIDFESLLHIFAVMQLSWNDITEFLARFLRLCLSSDSHDGAVWATLHVASELEASQTLFRHAWCRTGGEFHIMLWSTINKVESLQQHQTKALPASCASTSDPGPTLAFASECGNLFRWWYPIIAAAFCVFACWIIHASSTLEVVSCALRYLSEPQMTSICRCVITTEWLWLQSPYIWCVHIALQTLSWVGYTRKIIAAPKITATTIKRKKARKKGCVPHPSETKTIGRWGNSRTASATAWLVGLLFSNHRQ